jgi:hypothetical protein
MDHTIVGVDVATDEKKRFISVASYRNNTITLKWVGDGNEKERLYSEIASLIRTEKVLLALDAPLGWPAALSHILGNHAAGSRLDAHPDKMFRRATDDFIKEKIDKRPLDVGADRIARTAHAALSLLSELRTHIQKPIPLAWEVEFDSVTAIEVYPAATLIAHGRSASGYKGKEGRQARTEILSWLTKSMVVSADQRNLLLSNDNALDSALCVLAGRDFLLGNCYLPPDLDLAKKEGWIWVHRKE